MDEVKAGSWWCNPHGQVQPHRAGIVPACPDCGMLVLEAVTDRGRIVYREPQPARCAAGHPLGPGTVLLGWTGCGCNPAHGHRVWACQAPGCGDVQMWPPHRPVDDAPYFGPGKDDAWRAAG